MKRFLEKVRRWFCDLFWDAPVESPAPSEEQEERRVERIDFGAVTVVEGPPKSEVVQPGEFFLVAPRGKASWALFCCPCGCSSVVTLSLKEVHDPRWELTFSDLGRPSLYPSVWRNSGCCSHFWVKRGVVVWCRNTGMPPGSDQD